MQKLEILSSHQHNESALERSEAAIVERLTDGLEGRSKRFPVQFPEPLEQSFQLYNAEQALGALRTACLLLLALLLVSGLLDVFVMPDISGALWKVRIPAVGILIALFMLSYVSGFVGHQNWATFALIGTCTFAYLSLSHLDSAPYSYLYVGLLGVNAFFLLLMSRSLFKWGVICSAVMLVSANLYWNVFYSTGAEQLVVYNGMLVSCLGLCIVANYMREKEIRQSYLQLQHDRLSRFAPRDLEDSDNRFRFLVSLDSVTGIANKSSMDRGLKLEWERAARRKQYLSLLVVTIDEFEGYQQCYGMIESEHCLKKVAAEIKRFARRPGDIAASYGENQFHIVLSDTSIDNAMFVAQNMLNNVRSLELPDDFSDIDPSVTLSIGVASLVPLPSMFPADLVEKARRANKAAKKQGANRVVSFSDII